MTYKLVDKYLKNNLIFKEYDEITNRIETDSIIQWEIPCLGYSNYNLKYHKESKIFETYFGEKHKNFDLLNEIKKIFKTHPKCKIIRVVLQNNEDELYCLETSEVKIACIFAFNADQKDLNILD